MGDNGDGIRIDLDLHGVLGVRLIDASPADLAGVRRQLGPLPGTTLSREPDLCVRFVASLPAPGLRHLEARRSGFTDDGFILVSGAGRQARARIPFESPGELGEIVCERGMGRVPLLAEALRLAALRKGVVSLHASAFEYRGRGAIVAGWANGGKTSALLAFLERGAAFVGDDPVLLAGDGGRMFGTAAPIELSGWQLRQLPRLWRRVGRARRFLLGSLGRAERLLPPLERRLRVHLPAEEVCSGAGSRVSAPRALFLLMTHDAPEIRLEPADPEATLRRMVQLARLEWLTLERHCLAYRFAFPDRTSAPLDGVRETEAALLRSALAGLETFVVRHPRPVSLRHLFTAMRPAFAAGAAPVPEGAR